jgi:hypothetical protein
MAAAQYAEAALGALVLAGLALLICAWEQGDLWHPNHSVAGDVLHANDSAAGPSGDAGRHLAEARQRRLLLLAGLALGLSTLVKHEGALFLAAAALVLLGSRPRALLPFALGALAPLCLLVWFVHGFAPASDLAPGGLRQLLHRALSPSRAAIIVSALARRLVFFQRWALHLAAFTALLAVRLWRGDLEPRARRLLTLCALALLGFLIALLSTPHPLDWHLRTSIDRLLLQLWPAAVVALALQRAPASA